MKSKQFQESKGRKYGKKTFFLMLIQVKQNVLCTFVLFYFFINALKHTNSGLLNSKYILNCNVYSVYCYTLIKTNHITFKQGFIIPDYYYSLTSLRWNLCIRPSFLFCCLVQMFVLLIFVVSLSVIHWHNALICMHCSHFTFTRLKSIPDTHE